MLPDTCKDISYYVGVGLGQARGRSIIATLKKSNWETGERNRYDFSRRMFTRLEVCQLDQFELGAPYSDVGARAAQISRNQAISGNVTFIVNATGEGSPFVSLLHRQNLGVCRILAVSITGADAEVHQNNCYYVPQRALLSALLRSFEAGNLVVSAALPGSGQLLDEISAIRAQFAADGSQALQGNESDILPAVALANWRARKFNFFS